MDTIRSMLQGAVGAAGAGSGTGATGVGNGGDGGPQELNPDAVSYTHLTLPTILRV